jgi:hypothetical protein
MSTLFEDIILLRIARRISFRHITFANIAKT